MSFVIFVSSWLRLRAQNVHSSGGHGQRMAANLSGKLGEDLACAELARRGYAILERRYRTRYGEIDIVARSGDSLVFVEVKARDGQRVRRRRGRGDRWKQQRIVRMAMDFLARRRLQDRPCRFDVVTVDFEGGDPSIEVYPHAFTA